MYEIQRTKIDTFFIGQIGDPNQVAAVSLCMPMFVFLTGLANLFGIGGSSLMSRCLGALDPQKARQTAAFSIWTSVGVSLAYGLLLHLLAPVLLPALGADSQTYEFCRQYVFWTITVGAIVHAFIDDAETVRYGQTFQRIICITGPCISVTMLAITAFQSVGKKLEPTVLSLLRKGGVDIPFMLILNALAGVDGIVWATPIADLIAMTTAIVLFLPFWRRLSGLAKQEGV